MTSTQIINILIGLLERYKAHVAGLSEHLPPVSLPQHAQLEQTTEDLHGATTEAVSAAKEHIAPLPPMGSSSSESSESSSSSATGPLDLGVLTPLEPTVYRDPFGKPEESSSSSSSSGDIARHGA